MRLEEGQWPPAIDLLLIKQLYLLREMCWIPLPIGDDLPGPRMQQNLPDFYRYDTEGRRGKLGSVLQIRIEDYVKQKDSWWCDYYPWLMRKETRREGYGGFHMLWDHGKCALKQYSLGRSSMQKVELSEAEVEYERVHLWMESSDEENEA